MRKSILNQLSMGDLNEIFDLHILGPVTSLVKGCSEAGNQFNILADKEILCNLLIDLLTPEDLLKSSVRKKLIESLTDKQQKDIANILRKNDYKCSNLKWGDNQETKAFLEVCGLPDTLLPIQTKKSSSLEKAQISFVPFKQLKEYQAKITYHLEVILTSPRARAMICMPTGSGKTRTVMETVCSFFNRNSDKSILWLVDSVELMMQAAECFKQSWLHL